MDAKSLKIIRTALKNMKVRDELIENVMDKIREVENKETGGDITGSRKEIKVRLSKNEKIAEEQRAMVVMGAELEGMFWNDYLLKTTLSRAKRKAWREPEEAFRAACSADVYDELPEYMQSFLWSHKDYKKKYTTLRPQTKFKKSKAEEEEEN